MLQPIVIEGNHVRLEPYEESHVPGLWAVAQHPQLWEYMPFEMSTRDHLADLVQRMIQMASSGVALGFAQVARATSAIVGGTSFLAYEPNHRRVEIGATWITPSWQRTAVNTEAKLLLMTHAFEQLDCIRVEFKTDALNLQSQRALDRIGAIREGTLRAHMIMPGGRFRDSVYYSILQTEWPAVKENLNKRLHAAEDTRRA